MTKKPGRPSGGKRSCGNYRQISVWVDKSLHADVLKALVTSSGKKYEVSDLVGVLFTRWLKEGATPPPELVIDDLPVPEPDSADITQELEHLLKRDDEVDNRLTMLERQIAGMKAIFDTRVGV